MKNINYIGEHLLIGNIGHAFIVLSLVAALVSVVSYYFYSKNDTKKESIMDKINKTKNDLPKKLKKHVTDLKVEEIKDEIKSEVKSEIQKIKVEIN